jgi:hypothetical protein
MPVTPLSTPLKTEYKPLGLEAFAQPLSQMAAQFDAVSAELEDTDYTLSRLSQDDPKAKELLGKYEDEAAKISEDLLKNQNYRQAHNRIKKLNKKFAKDIEVQAYKSNYTLNTDLIKQADKLYNEKKITHNEYQNWLYYQQNSYKGAMFDPSTGQYTKPNTSLPAMSQEEAIEDRVKELAGMAATQEREWIEFVGGTDPATADRLKKTLKSKDANQIKSEIRNYLLNSDRFKNYVVDKAKYEFYRNNDMSKKQNAAAGKNPYEYSENLIQDFQDRNQAQLEVLQKALPSATGDQKISIENSINAIQDNLNNFNEQYQSIQNPEELEQLASQVYKEQALGYFDRIAGAGADIVDFNKTGLSYTENTESAARRKKANDEYKEIGNVATTVTQLGPADADKYKISSGTPGIGTQEENLALGIGNNLTNDMIEAKENLYSQSPKLPDTETVFTPETKGFIESGGLTNGKMLANSGLTADNILEIETATEAYALIGQGKQAQSTIKKNRDSYASLQNQLSTTQDPAERNRIQSQMSALAEETAEAQLAVDSQLKVLDNLIKSGDFSGFSRTSTFVEGMGPYPENLKSNAEIEIQKYKENKSQYKNPIELMDAILTMSKDEINIGAPLTAEQETLKNTSSSDIQKLNTELQTLKEEASRRRYTWDDPNKPTTFATQQERDRRDYVVNRIGEIENNLETIQDLNDVPFNIETKGTTGRRNISTIRNIVERYERLFKIESPTVVTPTALVINDRANKLTDDTFKEEVEIIKANSVGSNKFYSVENYNALTGEHNKKEDQGYNLDFYEENPKLVGYSEGNPVYQYTLKPDFANNKYSSVGIAKKIASGGFVIETPSDRARAINDYDKASFYANNPVDLYIVASGVNLNPKEKAAQKYADIYTYGDEDAKKNMLDNYASIGLIASPNRKAYHENAEYLQDKLKNNQNSQNIYEPPAVWKDNEDGTETGYGINYVTQNGKLYARVIPVIKEGMDLTYDMNNIITQEMSYKNSLPLAMFKLNLQFGAGSEADIPEVSSGMRTTPFVPAFLQP